MRTDKKHSIFTCRPRQQKMGIFILHFQLSSNCINGVSGYTRTDSFSHPFPIFHIKIRLNISVHSMKFEEFGRNGSVENSQPKREHKQ